MVALLAGCGGSSSKQPTVADLAAKLNKAGVECRVAVNETLELGARESAQCQRTGESLTLLTYNTNSARDVGNTIAREFGSISVLGDRWAVRVPDDATAKRVQDALGGRLA